MNIGKFTLTALETGRFGLDGGAMFGVVPKPLWSKAYNPGDEVNRIPMAAASVLVQWDDKAMLIDTGNGHKLDEKLQKIYAIDTTRGTLEHSLQAVGLTTDSITHVLLTHMHFDHVGGATKFQGGEVVPTFTNARYLVQREQLEWALQPSDKDKASYMPPNYMPLINNSVLDAVDGDVELFPGVSVHRVYGHTKAMQIVQISDGGETFTFCADLFPTHAHVAIPYVMGYDNHPLTTIEEKKHWLPILHEQNSWVFFGHDAFYQVGKIHHTEKGFVIGDLKELM